MRLAILLLALAALGGCAGAPATVVRSFKHGDNPYTLQKRGEEIALLHYQEVVVGWGAWEDIRIVGGPKFFDLRYFIKKDGRWFRYDRFKRRDEAVREMQPWSDVRDFGPLRLAVVGPNEAVLASPDYTVPVGARIFRSNDITRININSDFHQDRVLYRARPEGGEDLLMHIEHSWFWWHGRAPHTERWLGRLADGGYAVYAPVRGEAVPLKSSSFPRVLSHRNRVFGLLVRGDDGIGRWIDAQDNFTVHEGVDEAWVDDLSRWLPRAKPEEVGVFARHGKGAKSPGWKLHAYDPQYNRTVVRLEGIPAELDLDGAVAALPEALKKQDADQAAEAVRLAEARKAHEAKIAALHGRWTDGGRTADGIDDPDGGLLYDHYHYERAVQKRHLEEQDLLAAAFLRRHLGRAAETCLDDPASTADKARAAAATSTWLYRWLDRRAAADAELLLGNAAWNPAAAARLRKIDVLLRRTSEALGPALEARNLTAWTTGLRLRCLAALAARGQEDADAEALKTLLAEHGRSLYPTTREAAEKVSKEALARMEERKSRARWGKIQEEIRNAEQARLKDKLDTGPARSTFTPSRYDGAGFWAQHQRVMDAHNAWMDRNTRR